jgi:hypothetical protein
MTEVTGAKATPVKLSTLLRQLHLGVLHIRVVMKIIRNVAKRSCV